MALNKWRFYVECLGKSEENLKAAINEWRRFKKIVIKQRYENEVKTQDMEWLNTRPIYFLDKIEDEKIKIEFCKKKIEYYKEIHISGKVMENEEKLLRLNGELAEMMKKHNTVLQDLNQLSEKSN